MIVPSRMLRNRQSAGESCRNAPELLDHRSGAMEHEPYRVRANGRMPTEAVISPPARRVTPWDFEGIAAAPRLEARLTAWCGLAGSLHSAGRMAVSTRLRRPHRRRKLVCLTVAGMALAAPVALAQRGTPPPSPPPPTVTDALDRMNEAIAALTRKVWPSVVQIRSRARRAGQRAARRNRRRSSGGSDRSAPGSSSTPDGYIMTNAHVVDGAQRVAGGAAAGQCRRNAGDGAVAEAEHRPRADRRHGDRARHGAAEGGRREAAGAAARDLHATCARARRCLRSGARAACATR